MNYWLFQGNKKYYSFEQAIKENVLDCWGITRHVDKISIGDKIIFWCAGTRRGVSGVGEVTELSVVPKDKHCWKIEKANRQSVAIKFYSNLSIMLEPIQLTNEE